MSHPIVILRMGETFPELRVRRGDFADWFAAGLAVRTTVVDAREDDVSLLPCSGIVITGSECMVTDELPFVERWRPALLDAIEAGIPVLAVCFGHQLLAQWLGGRVGYHPQGYHVGSTLLRRTAVADCLLDADDYVHVSHSQVVLDKPSSAVVLGTAEHDPHHMLRYGDRVWTCQFHPEFDEDIAAAYVAHSQSSSVRMRAMPSRQSTALLQRFAQVCFALC